MSRHERRTDSITASEAVETTQRVDRRVSTKLPSHREQYLDRAATVLHQYIAEVLGITVRTFAKSNRKEGRKVSESTLRHFLERQHKRAPYTRTLEEITKAPGLPTNVRSALNDVIEFD